MHKCKKLLIYVADNLKIVDSEQQDKLVAITLVNRIWHVPR